MNSYTKELEVAQQIALKAGAYLREAQSENTIVKQPHESHLDITTRADLEVERMVIEALEQAFPDDQILSEETRTDVSLDAERTWIIDPIDGTTNYVKGLDAYAVSIALAVRSKVMLGVVYLPVRDRLFHAVRGQGVFCNELPLTLATADDPLPKSIISVGFPHVREAIVADRAFTLYKNLWIAASDLRRSGSAVFDGCLLAEGITGAYVTPDIRPWDIAATSLFVEEQGGIVSDLSGAPLDLFRKEKDRFCTSALFAKNEKIHSAVKTVIHSL